MISSLLVRLRFFSALMCCSLLLTASSFAQGYFGTVSGVVSDPSGAVIANAKVTLFDQEKGFTFEGKSDGDGRYIFRAVPPGVYRVLAEAPGFSQQEKTNIRVDVSTNPSANLRMFISPTGSPRWPQISSVRAGLALPVKILIRSGFIARAGFGAAISRYLSCPVCLACSD